MKNTKVKANKNLGQHFLNNPNIIEKIISFIKPDKDESLVEIGPGLGAITIPVLKKGLSLTAIELDKRVIPVLEEKAKLIGNLNIIEDDILKVNFNKLIDKESAFIFGNLPYNISSPILFNLVGVSKIRKMVFMLQKEVVDRMVASTGSKDYGRLSIALNRTHEISALFDVPKSAFSPPPKVTSTMVMLEKRQKPLWDVLSTKDFEKVVKLAFSMRRKTIRNNFKGILKEYDWDVLNIDPGLRAEVLDGAKFATITNYITKKERG